MCEFEQLHQFLKDQERLLLTQLVDLDQAITRVQEEAVAKVSEEMSHLDTLIWEMEGKFQQPASQFLQVRARSIRAGGGRRDRAKPGTWEPKSSPMGTPWCLPALLQLGSSRGQGPSSLLHCHITFVRRRNTCCSSSPTVSLLSSHL